MVSKKSKPNIVLTANLWSLVGHPSTAREWSLEQKIKAVKDAGFHAITTVAGPEHKKLLEKYDLRLMGYFSSAKPSEFPKLIKSQVNAGAENINVQLGDHDTLPAKAAKMAVSLIKEGRKQGIDIYVEVHRDTATETPEKTFEIAKIYRKTTGEYLPITWDHSHLATVKHLRPAEYSERLLKPKNLHQLTPLYHCRPFNGHHCQIPVTNGRGRMTPEFKDWMKFIDDLFDLWLKGPRPNNEIWVCPEIGPVLGGYNLSSLPPSWHEAIICSRQILKSWKKAVKANS